MFMYHSDEITLVHDQYLVRLENESVICSEVSKVEVDETHVKMYDTNKSIVFMWRKEDVVSIMKS